MDIDIKPGVLLQKLIPGSYFKTAIILLAGLFLGWLFFHRTAAVHEKRNETVAKITTEWTCAMHPQIRMDHPGQCPICGMELIPVTQQVSRISPEEVLMTPEAIELAKVETNLVRKGNASQEVRLYGNINPDERLIQTQPAYVLGRIEQLILNFTGESVQKGQTIAVIYSPELITAQKELLEAMKMKNTYPAIYNAAREKLRSWNLTESQISGIESTGAIREAFEVKSNTSGIVLVKHKNVGDYVSPGDPVYEISDLSKVWALFDVYEADLTWLTTGDDMTFTTESLPGKVFRGEISFIDPVVNTETRVARVRVEVENHQFLVNRGCLSPDLHVAP